MDPITHALLGGVVGRTAGGRRLGMRAAALGAVAGAFPDIDVFYGVFAADEMAQLQWHRGLTHSLFFSPLLGLLGGWLYWRWRHRRGALEPLIPWLAVSVFALLSHPLLDACTTYGTQLLAPFSDRRFAWNAVPIIEPVYSGTLLLGLVIARYAKTLGWLVALVVLVLSSEYLMWGWMQNNRAIILARTQLSDEGVARAQVEAFPTLLQMPVRRVVVRTGEQIRVGYVDVSAPCLIQWQSVAQQRHPLLEKFRASRHGQIFTWFANGITAERIERRAGDYWVEISDLRYGYDANPTRGLWGVRGRFSHAGEPLGENRYFSDPWRFDRATARLLWAMVVPSTASNCRNASLAAAPANSAVHPSR